MHAKLAPRSSQRLGGGSSSSACCCYSSRPYGLPPSLPQREAQRDVVGALHVLEQEGVVRLLGAEERRGGAHSTHGCVPSSAPAFAQPGWQQKRPLHTGIKQHMGISVAA